MRSSIANRPFRKRYFIAIGLAFFVAIWLNPDFQTFACRIALNKATLEEGYKWNVGSASFKLFPFSIELKDLSATNAMGTNLHFEQATIQITSLIGPTRQIDHIQIEGVHGMVFTSDVHSPYKSAEDARESLFVEEASFSDVHVEIHSQRAAVLLEWEKLTIDELKLDGSAVSGYLQLPQAKVSPLPLSDVPWSGAWESPTTIEGFVLDIQSVDSTQQISLETASNWGLVSMDWHTNTEQSTMDFKVAPRLERWPVRSDHWLSELPYFASDSTITGCFTWDTQAGITGFFSQLDIKVPVAYKDTSWQAGPIEINSFQIQTLADIAGIRLPTFFSSHDQWILEVDQEGLRTIGRLTPHADSNQKFEVILDNTNDQTKFSAVINGFAFDISEQDLCTGSWELAVNGYAIHDGWSGNVNVSHPGGDAITTVWNVAFNPSTWTIDTETRIEQLAPQLEPNYPGKLFAKIGWQVSGTDWQNWTQVLEVRDLFLIQNSTHKALGPFSAIQKRIHDVWSLSWDSGFTSGEIEGNTTLLTDWSFNLQRMAFEPKNDSCLLLPQLNARINVMNFQPIALLTNLPLTTSESFVLEAQWNGYDGKVSTSVPSFSFRDINVNSISIEGVLSSYRPSILDWELRGLCFKSNPIIAVADGRIETRNEELKLEIQTLTGEAGGQIFSLDEPSSVVIDSKTARLHTLSMPLRSNGGLLELSGEFTTQNDWDLKASISHDSLHWNDGLHGFKGVHGSIILQSNEDQPEVQGFLHCKSASWNDFAAMNAQVTASGSISAPHLELRAEAFPSGIIEVILDLPIGDMRSGKATITFTDLDLAPINQQMPPGSIGLFGKVSGRLTALGFDQFPRISGRIVPRDLLLTIPYLGTRYRADGIVKVEPEGFFMDQWFLRDREERTSRFNGTLLHSAFKEWDLDFGIEIQEQPIELMNIPITDDALFYGSARGTGDINISGYGPILEIEANIKTGLGTDFALPMDSQSDVDYADFVRFKKHNENSNAAVAPRGTFSNARLNLGVDINDGAQARIVFDRKVGDEIVGNAIGHLDLAVNNFEQLDMTGSLEITEGAYHFTLKNWLNKRFDIQPGSTVSWEGNPYDAKLNVATTFTTRTTLEPLLPDVEDLPSRMPVNLQLQLAGSLLRPALDFDVVVPNADSRIQALVEGALVSEEEVQRQALGLLTLNQFIPTDPTEAAVGGFIQPAQSAQLLANQLGHWISQIAPAMDVGLDYAQDALSGQQAVGLALSTQLLNNRLHIEGEVGALSMGSVNAEDFQLQDLTVSFDLSDDGAVQLTGHSRQSTSLTNAIEGDAVQGVGVRFKWAFDEWRGRKIQ